MNQIKKGSVSKTLPFYVLEAISHAFLYSIKAESKSISEGMSYSSEAWLSSA